MTDKISLAQVHKSFASKQVLRGLTLNIEKGQSMVVIGGSGSGKSVMLKSILGLLTPDSGSITIDGQETVGLARHKRSAIDAQIGMLFQNGALFDSLPVWKNVAFRGLQNEGMSEDEARQVGTQALRRVGLGAELLDLFPAALSGGMHKRVGLARAIAASPEIIFFDEPTTGLDPIMTDVINHLIEDCVQDLGATTLTITHDMTSVRAIADKTALLYKGEIIWHGDQEALDASEDPFLHQFIHGLAHGPIEVEGQQLETALAGLES
ncbi:MAG: ATP-binding cassette domain-containing protein [Rhodobiaceae bacterium]|jgi:phospholipid/cholesterol/gamma-HCH transport system ATP-binding protein|nr:ATP-binding cassette domain-containing protein [Rhodobiaceae bacterium]